MNYQPTYFSEISTLTDIEMDEIIADLRGKILLKGRKSHLVQIQRSTYSTPGWDSSWGVSISIEGAKEDPADMDDREYLYAEGNFLHIALNNMLDKIKVLPNLELILGYKNNAST